MEHPFSFSDRLRYERNLRGWSRADVAERVGCDTKTVGRWENEGKLPRPEARRKLCELFNITIAEFGLLPPGRPIKGEATPSVSASAAAHHQDAPAGMPRIDLEEMPPLEGVYGRAEELATLKRWADEEQCRVIAVLGVGGVGKTSVTALLTVQVKERFSHVFWRSLHNAPPLKHILREAIQFFSDQQQIKLPVDVEEQIQLLLQLLRAHRCLLVLDNLESVLQAGRRTGSYKEGYEGYGRLIQRIGESAHQSCLLLTSRETPREVARLEGKTKPVRSRTLQGVGLEEVKELLKDKDIRGLDEHWAELIRAYAGNPLALKLVAQYIQELFEGDIARFLAEGQVAFGDISELLDQQAQRLSPSEREIMYWLAIERETVSVDDVHNNLVRPLSRGELLEILDSLYRRSFIENRGPARFALQPVILEYVTNSLVKRACRDFEAEQPGVWTNFALMKAQAKDYVRESQQRLIMEPVIKRLLAEHGKEEIAARLKTLLARQRQARSQQRNYLAGNALNLLISMKYDLHGFDCSRLVVWQANLQGISLPEVNFTAAEFIDCAFSDMFSNILSVAFSPDGALLAAGTATGDIWIYSAQSGVPLHTFHGHTDGVWSVAFSPDGHLLASGSDDHHVMLWDVASGRCLHVLREHAGRVRAVAFDPSGSMLASGSDDRTIRLWTAASWQCCAILEGHRDRVWSVAFHPDGAVLASGSTDKTIRLWTVKTGECFKVIEGHTDWVRSVVFHPSGELIASGSNDQSARVWDVASGACLRVFRGHSNRVWSIAFSPNGALLASGSEDHTARIWEVATGRALKTLQHHIHGVRAIVFNPGGDLLASGGDDQCLRLWDVATGHCLKTLQGHTNRIWSVDFSQDGTILVSSSEDQQIRLWDVHHVRSLQTVHDPAHGIRFACISPDGHLLASCGEDQTVRLWERESGRLLVSLKGHSNWIRFVTFNHKGNLLASCGEDQSIRIWSVESRRFLYELIDHTSWVRSLAFSPDDSILASGGDDQGVRLWSLEHRQCFKILPGHADRVRSVAFSPDGSILASGSEDRTIRLWNVAEGDCVRTLRGHTSWIMSVAFSPDGSMLASGGDDQVIYLWDVRADVPLEKLTGHQGRIRSVAFSPTERYLASGGDDGKILLWDVESGACLQSYLALRPYEQMNISGAEGLTHAQRTTLRALGAIEKEPAHL